MPTIDQIINQGLENVITSIKIQQRQRTRYDGRAIVSTQTSINSLRVVGKGNKAGIEATEYTGSLFEGVGKQPRVVSKDLIDSLQSWNKLSVEEGQTKVQAAFSVAHAIIEFGTTIKRGTSEGINIDKIVERGADQLADELGDQLVEDSLDVFNKLT